jgi:hypothetical protein
VRAFLTQCDGFLDALFELGAVNSEVSYNHSQLARRPSWATDWRDGTLTYIHLPDPSFESDCKSEADWTEQGCGLGRSRAHTGLCISHGHNASGQLSWLRITVSTSIRYGIRNPNWMQSNYVVTVDRGTVSNGVRVERTQQLRVGDVSATDVLNGRQQYVLDRLSENAMIMDQLIDAPSQIDDGSCEHVEAVHECGSAEWQLGKVHLDRTDGAA